MKKLLHTFSIYLLVFVTVNAQARNDGTQNIAGQSSRLQAASSPSSEIIEANRLNTSVVKLYAEGKYEEALPLAGRALELKEKVLGPDHQDLIPLLRNLAELYIAQKKFAQSEPFLKRMLAICENTFGLMDARISSILDRPALVYYVKGDNGKTESAYQRALAIREKALGAEHKGVAQSAYNLAEFYQFSGDFAKADPLYERAIRIWEKALGTQDAKVGEALIRYACLMRKRKKKDRADELQERANSILGVEINDRFNVLLPDQEILKGKAASLPEPTYPREAIAARVTGKVNVVVTINERGEVISACAISGHPLLAKASEQAAYRATFTPTLIDGSQ
jgi:tetratricopeptide (TPR) repeat protein